MTTSWITQLSMEPVLDRCRRRQRRGHPSPHHRRRLVHGEPVGRRGHPGVREVLEAGHRRRRDAQRPRGARRRRPARRCSTRPSRGWTARCATRSTSARTRCSSVRWSTPAIRDDDGPRGVDERHPHEVRRRQAPLSTPTTEVLGGHLLRHDHPPRVDDISSHLHLVDLVETYDDPVVAKVRLVRHEELVAARRPPAPRAPPSGTRSPSASRRARRRATRCVRPGTSPDRGRTPRRRAEGCNASGRTSSIVTNGYSQSSSLNCADSARESPKISSEAGQTPQCRANPDRARSCRTTPDERRHGDDWAQLVTFFMIWLLW